MPGRAALLALMLLAACSGGAPVPDDPPRLASPSAIVPRAAIGASLVFPVVASASAVASSTAPVSPWGGKGGGVVRDSPPVLSNTGLDDAVVRRIVRQNFGRVRLCYRTAALADPTLAGTVVVRYRIETSGAVGVVNDAGSTVSSTDLIACVLRVFNLLAFPSPSMGPVEVTETLYFTPPAP